MARQKRDLSHLKVYHTEVVRTASLTPRMNRITLGGIDLPAFQSAGPDQFIYVFFAKSGQQSLYPVERDFTWDSVRGRPVEERPTGRYYTVRHHRVVNAELDIDMVLHGEGPGATFGATARPGDPVAFWGPRIAYEPPPQRDLTLLFADQTGLPATAAILESLPAGHKARAFIEVPDASEEQPIASSGDIELTWLHRGEAPAGKTELLLDAICRTDLPEGGVYAWGAGEYRSMQQIRRHLQEERCLSSDDVTVIGYWRHRDHPIEEAEG